jgi:hypothetical protein
MAFNLSCFIAVLFFTIHDSTIHISTVSMFHWQVLSTRICFNYNFCTWEGEAHFVIQHCWYAQSERSLWCDHAPLPFLLSYSCISYANTKKYYFLCIHSHSCHCTVYSVQHMNCQNIKLLKYGCIVIKMVETFVIEILKVERCVAARPDSQAKALLKIALNKHRYSMKLRISCPLIFDSIQTLAFRVSCRISQLIFKPLWTIVRIDWWKTKGLKSCDTVPLQGQCHEIFDPFYSRSLVQGIKPLRTWLDQYLYLRHSVEMFNSAVSLRSVLLAMILHSWECSVGLPILRNETRCEIKWILEWLK